MRHSKCLTCRLFMWSAVQCCQFQQLLPPLENCFSCMCVSIHREKKREGARQTQSNGDRWAPKHGRNDQRLLLAKSCTNQPRLARPCVHQTMSRRDGIGVGCQLPMCMDELKVLVPSPASRGLLEISNMLKAISRVLAQNNALWLSSALPESTCQQYHQHACSIESGPSGKRNHRLLLQVWGSILLTRRTGRAAEHRALGDA